MPIAEYHCTVCKIEYEYHFTLEQWPYVEEFQCVSCGGRATRYFSAAPAMSPDPHWAGGYDVQLGRYITSRDEKRRLLKAKGLEEVSEGEFNRGVASVKDGKDIIPENDPKFREAMEKAYADTISGNVEPVTPRVVDFGDNAMIVS